MLHRRTRRYVSGELFARGRFGGTPYYDIAKIRRSRQVDGLALIFFIGLGDYLLATPVIEALRLAHPGLLIYAYVSTSADAVNSPLVATMLRTNRHIDGVFTYRGRPRRHWLDYDFRDCLKDIPKNFIILPMIYSTQPSVLHRVTSLLEAFNLPVTLPVPLPILELNELSATGAAILGDIRAKVAQHAPKALVCCHFGTRSSNYLYPYRDDVVRGLARSGYLVVAFSPTSVDDSMVLSVDVGEITPNDTIELLRSLKEGKHSLFVLSVNSIMWPVSAGLEIINLGLHIFFDEAVHQYVYPTTFVVTQHIYERLSPSRVFLAPEGSYQERDSDDGITVTDLDPGFVLDCFERMIRATP
jgi:hypothetical protein